MPCTQVNIRRPLSNRHLQKGIQIETQLMCLTTTFDAVATRWLMGLTRLAAHTSSTHSPLYCVQTLSLVLRELGSSFCSAERGFAFYYPAIIPFGYVELRLVAKNPSFYLDKPNKDSTE